MDKDCTSNDTEVLQQLSTNHQAVYPVNLLINNPATVTASSPHLSGFSTLITPTINTSASNIIDDSNIIAVITGTAGTATGTDTDCTGIALSTNTSVEPKSTINDSANSSTQVPSSIPAVAPLIDRGHILNVNVGILGHVDSGKTSLVKSLSTHLSTAALDKNPQSQQRGITLDLGFSAFTLPMPTHLISPETTDYSLIQFTLVDCPGHASLIRTIIGGAQIIDMIILVIDANKGIQTQTAECIVIGEITTDAMIIVLNKIDCIPEDDRAAKLEKVGRRIRKAFASTKFAHAPIITTAAAVGGEKVASVGAFTHTVPGKGSGNNSNSSSSANKLASYGIDELVDLIKNTVRIPKRNTKAPFYYAIDHCFPIKGHGTVLTGTVLSGSVSTNSIIEIPELQIQKKVKSLQMFRKNVKEAKQGDRVGICVTNLDAKLIERSIAADPGSVSLLSSALCLVKKVRFFKPACKTNSKFHISIGHATIVANAVFFGLNELNPSMEADEVGQGASSLPSTDSSTTRELKSQCSTVTSIITESLSDLDSEGEDKPPHNRLGNTQKEALSGGGKYRQSSLNATYHREFPTISFPFDQDFSFQEELLGSDGLQYGREPLQWCLLNFQQPVYCPLGSLIIGSRLDTDTHESSSESAQQCRLAFYGPIRDALKEDESVRIYVMKVKECVVHKVSDWRASDTSNDGGGGAEKGLAIEAIVKNLVGEKGSVTAFLGMKVETDSGEYGTIVSAFGSGGMCRVKFPMGVKGMKEGDAIYLRFKRYVYDKLKRMHQTGLYPPEGSESEPTPKMPAKEKEKEKPKEKGKEKAKESKGSVVNQAKKAEAKGNSGSASDTVVPPPLNASASSKLDVPLLSSSLTSSGSHPIVVLRSSSTIRSSNVTAAAASAAATTTRHSKALSSSETKSATLTAPIAVTSAPSPDKKPPNSRTGSVSTRSRDSAPSAAPKDAADSKAASSLKPAAAPAKAVFVNALPDYDRLVSNIKQAVKTASSKVREQQQQQASNPTTKPSLGVPVPATAAEDSSEKKVLEPAATTTKQVRILARHLEPEVEELKTPVVLPPTVPSKGEHYSWPERYPSESYFHPPSLSYFTSEPPLSLQSLPQQHLVQDSRYPYAHHSDPYIHRQQPPPPPPPPPPPQQQHQLQYHGQQFYPSMQSYPYVSDYPVRNDSFAPRARTAHRMRESRSSSSSRATKIHSQRAMSAVRGYQGSPSEDQQYYSPLKARAREQPRPLLSNTPQPPQFHQPNRYSAPLRRTPASEGPSSSTTSTTNNNHHRSSNAYPKPNAQTKGKTKGGEPSELYAINNTILRSGTIDVLKDPIAIEPGDDGPSSVEGQRFECAIVAGAFTMEENIRNYVDALTAIGPNGELGDLLGPFGKLGKCKIRIPGGYSGPPNGIIRFVAK